MKNKRGMALVVALLTAFILMALVASLFWIIAATSRQAEYSRNSALALNIAEAGVADAVYRLNYCTSSSDLYPFGGSSIPLTDAGNAVSTLKDFPLDILKTSSYPTLAVLSGSDNDGIQGTLNGGSYYVGLLNENNNPDTLISVGVYKGTRRIITIPLRGNNNPLYGRHPDPPPNDATQGISEAFNKHIIYANTIQCTTTADSGNVAYVNSCTLPAGSKWTKTKISPELFAPPVPNPKPLTVTDPDIGITAPTTRKFKDDNGTGSPYAGAVGYEPTFPGSYLGAGNTETYTLNSSCNIGANEIWRFEKSNTNLIVIINLANAPVVNGKIAVIDGSMSILGTNSAHAIGNNTPGQVVIWVERDLEIQPGSGTLTINGDLYSKGTGGWGIRIVTNGNGRINGWLRSNGIIDVASDNTLIGQPGTPTGLIATGKITLSGGTIYGGVSSGSEIDLSAGTINIYANSTSTDTALLVSSAGDATVKFDVAPANFRLGVKQAAAISAFSTGGNVAVTVNAPLNPTYNNSGQAAIVAYTSTGNSAVNISADTGAVNNGRLVYASGFDWANTQIVLAANHKIWGCLVTNGFAITNGTAQVIYDPSTYINASPGGDIYCGFGGGERVYVPEWRMWGLK